MLYRALATLRERGAIVLEPDTGALGSPGEWGVGRLPEPQERAAARGIAALYFVACRTLFFPAIPLNRNVLDVSTIFWHFLDFMWLVLVAILPIESVDPTPFQRDLSQAHHRRLADVLDRTGMFLDPISLSRCEWTATPVVPGEQA